MAKCFIAFLLVATMFPVCLRAQTRTYTTHDSVIANPERGFTWWSQTAPDYNTNASPGYSNIVLQDLISLRNDTDKITVLHRNFLLNDFINAPISSTYLANIQHDFDLIRNAGMKCVVRFMYNIDLNNPLQADKARVLQHIKQLAPVINANKDVVLVIQAGFIGSYGEWWKTGNSADFGDQSTGTITAGQFLNRKEVVDSLLAETSAEIPLQLRAIFFKHRMYGTTSLTASTAYQNTPYARIGFHNDAFLQLYGDAGTYYNTAWNNGSFDSAVNPTGTTTYVALSKDANYTPLGGEHGSYNWEPAVKPRQWSRNAALEFDSLNFSFYSRTSDSRYYRAWADSGYYRKIINGLGYRFSLISSTFSVVNNSLNVSIDLRNTGFARAFRKKTTYLVLHNTDSNAYYKVDLNTDCRTWEYTTNITRSVSMSSYPDGHYAAYLYLPDMNPSISNRSEYAIRFANVGVWQQATGYNDLAQTFTYARTTGVSPVPAKELLRIAPNPVRTELAVNGLNGTSDYRVVNSNGQIVMHGSCKKGDKINVAQLAPGMYFLNISRGRSATESIRFVKQ